MSKPKRERFISPKGVAVFPKLNTPDTKFKPEGEYTAKLAYDPNDPEVAKFVRMLEKKRDEEWEKFKSENPKKAKKATLAPVYSMEEDDEGEETGRILINFKMRASGVSKKTNKKFTMKPDIFDAHKTKLENPPMIGSGSVLRVSFELGGGWLVESSKNFHLSLRLCAVQIIDLVEFGVRDADSYGFDEEDDGFAASDEHTRKGSDFDDADEDYDEDDGDDDGDY